MHEILLVSFVIGTRDRAMGDKNSDIYSSIKYAIKEMEASGTIFRLRPNARKRVTSRSDGFITRMSLSGIQR